LEFARTTLQEITATLQSDDLQHVSLIRPSIRRSHCRFGASYISLLIRWTKLTITYSLDSLCGFSLQSYSTAQQLGWLFRNAPPTYIYLGRPPFLANANGTTSQGRAFHDAVKCYEHASSLERIALVLAERCAPDGARVYTGTCTLHVSFRVRSRSQLTRCIARHRVRLWTAKF